MQIVRNSSFDADALYKDEHLAIVSVEQTLRAEKLLRGCPLHRETPMHSFERLATRLGVSRVLVKDETARLGLSSFKALGGAYAVMLRSPDSPWCPRTPDVTGRTPPTFATATDGNHGISVAAGAWLSGSRSVCFLPEHVERIYEDSMRMLGAKVIRVPGNYDVAVAQVAPVAEQNGWTIVSDTTELPFNPITRDVLAGYGVMVNECLQQLTALGNLDGHDAVTHVFIQGGVGGLAAAFAGGLWQCLGRSRPTFVIVEPISADCLFQTAKYGEIRSATGDLATSMSMLSCGRPSRMAWTILKNAAEFFMTIDDNCAADGIKAYALEPATGMCATTPSGAAGLGGLIAAAMSVEARTSIGLNEDSIVLAVCSERRPDLAALESLMSARRQAVRV
jgi:diaminopropionate ammonia-lyase